MFFSLSLSLPAKVIQPKHAETLRPSSHNMKQTPSQERGSPGVRVTVLFPRFHRVDPMKHGTAKIKQVFLFECMDLKMAFQSKRAKRSLRSLLQVKSPKTPQERVALRFLHGRLRSSICGPESSARSRYSKQSVQDLSRL